MTGRLHFGQALGAVLVAAVVVVSGWTDVDRYFNKQMHDASVFAEHSATATFVGREAAGLPAGTRVIIDDRQLNEPSVQFLAPNLNKPEGYKPVLLPLTTPVDTVIFLSGDQAPDADYAQRLYPGSSVQRFTPTYGGPILMHEVRISRAQVEALQGLTVSYRAGGQTKLASVDGPLPQAPPGPLNAQIDGAVEASSYGDYGFRVEGAASVELSLDRQVIATSGAPVQVTLARGIHHLELKVGVDDAASPLRLLWWPASGSAFVAIPPQNLFSSNAVETGLLGRYYSNGSWTAPHALEQIDPFVSFYYQVTPLPLPFSVEWTGQIAMPVAGVYRLSSTSIDSSQLFLDGRQLGNDTPLSLPAGLHDIRLRFEAHSGHNHVELRWQPPGRELEVVPSQFLFPSASTGSAQPLPDLPAVNTVAGAPPPPAGPLKTLQPVWSHDFGSSSMPVSVALDKDGNAYVTDAARHALVKLDPAGNELWTAGAPARTAGFDQLAAVALARDGSVLVLDGESGVISRFSQAGQYVGAFAKDLATYHPRGLTVAPNGDVYVADTGGSHILHLSADGAPLGQIGQRGGDRGMLDQPSGIVVAADGSVTVVDPSGRKFVRFAPSGGASLEWPFGGGPTVNGPQLVLAPDGTLWASDTAAGILQTYSSAGQPQNGYSPSAGLVTPSGLAVGDGYVVVVEPEAKRVQRLTIPA